MKNKDITLQGGESMIYPSASLLELKLTTKNVVMKIRDQYTDGKFVTQKEYDKLIRRKKINDINEKNS